MRTRNNSLARRWVLERLATHEARGRKKLLEIEKQGFFRAATAAREQEENACRESSHLMANA